MPEPCAVRQQGRRSYMHHDDVDEKRAAWASLGAKLEVLLVG